MTDYFELGRITKPQGIRGEVKVEAWTDSLERFLKLEYVYFKDKNGDYRKQALTNVRIDARNVYLLLEGTADRNEAEALRGEILYIDRANATPLPTGSYYIRDLLGMDVLDDTGLALGTLRDILQTGSKDVYVVGCTKGGQLLFPSVEGVILSRDVEKKQMIVDACELEKVAVYDL